MKTCPNCAVTDLPDKAKVCGHCGTRLNATTTAERSPTPQPELDTTSDQVGATLAMHVGTAEASSKTAAETKDIEQEPWYLAARVWAAAALIGATLLLNLGWASLRIDGDLVRPRGAGGFGLASALGARSGFLEVWYSFEVLTVVFGLAVLVVGRRAKRTTATRTYRILGGTLVLLAVLHVYQIGSGNLTPHGGSLDGQFEYGLDGALGPWVTALLALGFFVPERFFRRRESRGSES